MLTKKHEYTCARRVAVDVLMFYVYENHYKHYNNTTDTAFLFCLDA